MSRQQYDPSSSPEPKSSTSRDGPPLALQVDPTAARRQAATTSEEPTPSSRSPPVVPSSSSEGYPSWLPKRPPPPPPHSTIHSVGMFEPGPSASAGGSEPFVGGRKPTPRSVRIVSMQNSAQGEKDIFGRREATDPSRFSGAAHARVWSRATSAGLTPTVFSPSPFQTHVPRPRFRTSSFRPELLRHPSWKMHLWYFLFAFFVFAHIPLQTFFDFNAVFILLLAAKFPNPAAPGVPGSGRNWALGAAAYIACWFTQIFVVFLVYELIYSFIRRWRIKRPLILPLYLSSPGFNFVSVSSYTNFCFMYFIRLSAFFSFGSSSSSESEEHSEDHHHGNIRDGLAETFYYYSQNLPTVALLMPRAALSLALLLAYSSVDPSLPVGDAGIFSRRDGTFFRPDGTLTGYARGVLIANAAWSAWRILVLLGSWVGLWIMSGQGFAGLCGPRYRWEEEDLEGEKTMAPYTFKDNASDHMDTPLPWSWREHTVLRVYEAWEFCLTNKYPGKNASGLEKKDGETSPGYEGMEKVFAAIGLAGVPQPAKRGALTEHLFDSPEPHEQGEGDDAEKMNTLVPPPAVLAAREKKGTAPASSSGPISKLPYPFTVPSSAQVSSASSSQEVVPFPPSPGLEVPITDEHGDHEEEHDDEDDNDEDDEDDDDGEEHEEEGEVEGEVEESEVPSSERRTSGSMSSLGRPIISRYPFQFRRPTRGGSVSSVSAMPPPTVSTPHSHLTHSTNPSHSTQSRSTRHSRSTQSTGNPESSDSPMSNGGSSSLSSPIASTSSGVGIPMPPRHPQVQRRARAGTVPVPTSPPTPSSPSPVVFPAGRPRARTRTESVGTDLSMTFGPIPIPSFDDTDDDDDDHYFHPGHDESLMDVPEAEGSIEEAEQHDSVGLLSAGPSPRGSLVNLRHLGSGLALHHHHLHHHRQSTGSRSRSTTSRSQSRSRTNSATSRSESARSRAQSLIQSLGAASRSSLDLVRSRANSMARLSDSPYSTSPDPQPSSPENHTFGHPLREQWRSSDLVDDIGDESMRSGLAEGDSGLLAASQVPLPDSPNSSATSSGSEPHTDFKSVGSQQAGQSTPYTPSEASRVPPSEPASEASRHTERGTAPISIARGGQLGVPQYTDSHPDISTADQSFVTAPATIEGRTDTSGQPSSWGTLEQYPQVPGGTWRPA